MRLAQRLESVGRLAGGVAHEFNNLLTVMNGYSCLLAQRLNAADPLHAYAEAISTSGERAASLTRQLLAFGRKQMLQPRALDVNAAVRALASMLQSVIGENIAIVTNLDAALGQVMADPDQLDQVMMNLVLNARDAMSSGGRLEIATANVALDRFGVAAIDPDATPGRYVLMTLTDTGHGMDEATCRRIFEPFFTTKGVGEGTGLGLATVYGIIRQSKGWITARSEVGVGTSFSIYLPRIDAVPAPAVRGIGLPSAGGCQTILLIEDEPSVLSFTRAVLNGHGYQTLEASTGEDALQVAARHSTPIQLLLTDVVLPAMNGRETSEKLRKIYPDLKVIFTSGYPKEVIGERGVLAGDVAFLQKPFSPDALAAKVLEVLAGPAKPLN